MKQSEFPRNWDDKRVQRVIIVHYQKQTEDGATDEDEGAPF